jgi:hypothetical protein
LDAISAIMTKVFVIVNEILRHSEVEAKAADAARETHAVRRCYIVRPRRGRFGKLEMTLRRL